MVPLQRPRTASQPWDVGSAAFDSRFPAWPTRCQMYGALIPDPSTMMGPATSEVWIIRDGHILQG